MKLHLPLSLRSALLAACIVYGTSHSKALAYSYTDTAPMEYGQEVGYNGDSVAMSSISTECEWNEERIPPGVYSPVYKPGYTYVEVDGKSYKIPNKYIFHYYYSYEMREVGSNMEYSMPHIEQTGAGASDDLTYQCTKFDNGGNILIPGVWILSRHSDGGKLSLKNYGDITVNDSRHQYYFCIPISLSEYRYEMHYLKDMGCHVLFNSAASSLGFNLSVTDSKSFAFTRGYGVNGTFTSGACQIEFDHVGTVSFTDNVSTGDQGGLMYNFGHGWNFSVINAENVEFSGNSNKSGGSAIGYCNPSSLGVGGSHACFTLDTISGTALFENNSGSELFRTVDSTFANVHELVFRGNSTRIWRGYNTSYTVEINDCDSVIFEGNGSEEYSGTIAANSINEANISFKNLGDLIFRNNKTSHYLFDTSVKLISDGIDSVSFIGNSASDGAVLGADMVFDHITKSFLIEDNHAVKEGDYTYGALFSGSSVGRLTVNGKEDGRAEIFFCHQ